MAARPVSRSPQAARSPVDRDGRPGTVVHSSWRDRGAAAVEAAFVLPILLLVLFAIIDFGRMLNAQLNATEAAGQGARVAAFGNDPGERVREIAGDGATVPTGAYCSGDDPAEEDAEVTVTYRFEFVTPVGALAGLFDGGGFDSELTLTGRGVMPCQ
jgi:Flp pilus assembly protein TadG